MVRENTILLFIVVTAVVNPIVSQLNNEEQTRCVKGQKLRIKFCCWTTQCEDQGFLPCNTHNGTDVCEQCPDGEYVRGVYPTKGFERSPCVEIPRCLQEEVRDDSGKCVCNRAEGYIRKLDYCEPTDIQCDKPGIELSEQGFCEPCKENFYKNVYSKDLCKRKTNITCSSGQFVDNGNTKSDRICIDVTTAKQWTTTENAITAASNPGNSNGLDISDIIGITVGCILLVIIVSFVIYMIFCYMKIQRKQQSENIDKTERGESTPLNKNDTTDESFSGTIEIATTHFDGGNTEHDLEAMADPVDDDETFVKELDDNNDDNLLSIAAGGSPENGFNILSAQQPQDEQPDMRPIEQRPTARVEAQVHVEELPKLLTENPENDDSGRFLLNGETSLSMQYHNGNVNH
ncbi:uncharacterized protein LOC134689780 [Mytilus trossulus]|uniref:uncharacterized protein LOC134689780 n=1 Tax=Mytilus trossulus TaxID=6551 RepID=UPI0030041577